MKSLVQLFDDAVASIGPYGDGVTSSGVEIVFKDETNLWVEHNIGLNDENKPVISIWGTSVNGGTNTRVILDGFTITKAKLVVQELSSLIELMESKVAERS